MKHENKQKSGYELGFWFWSLIMFATIVGYLFTYSKVEDKKSEAHIASLVKAELNKQLLPKAEYNPYYPVMYNNNSLLAKSKISIIRVALTSSPQTVDLTATGFANIYMVIPQGENNTSTITAMPNCSLKSFTATSAIVNTTVSASTTVSILGVNILGLATPTNFTGMYVNLIVIGN